jgi:DNA polymerase-1
MPKGQITMTTELNKPIILIDGSSYLYRAFHAMPSLGNSKGIPTGAIYGVVNMLRRLLKEYNPEQIAVIFDAKGKTFRDDLYDKYKANRAEMPSELAQQIEPIHQIIKALGLPIIMVPGVEADDVIGTLAWEATQKGIPILISTSDKDLAQLVNEHVTLVNTMSDTILNPLSVKEKFGIPPELIIDYLALVGDTSDNIPGVPQVGPKTAVKWLLEHGSLDNIILNADKITGKVGDNLRASLTQIPLAKQLTTIKLDVVLDMALGDLKRKNPDNNLLMQLYKEFEFKNWLNELLATNTTIEDDKHKHYETIFTKEALKKWIKTLSESSIFAFDTETTSLNYMNAEIVGVSFACEAGKAAYVPCAHDYTDAPEQLSRHYVLEELKDILENPNIQKIGQNIKYDVEVLATYSIHMQGIAYDTMLESYILDSSSNNHDMDSLALKHLGWRAISYEDVAGKGAKQIPFNHVTIEKAAAYAAEDADITLQLHHHMWPDLEKEPGLKHVFTAIEMPLVPVLASIERNGVLVDADMLEKQTTELEKRSLELENEAYHLASEEFNLSSPKQLQEILFQKLGIPVLQKTPTGQASTAESVLQELALEFPLPKIIIEHRSINKLISTYTKKLPQQINTHTGRIHTSYNQTGAATGRLSSSDPNLQNIPVRTYEGRRIRQAFIASPGYKIISADYSQIELRIMAHISNDKGLLKAFENNLDVHEATAAEILDIPINEVTHDQRRSAKAINFGLIYGMSAFGLAKQLGISRHDAQAYIDKYFARYPGVHTYMENTRTSAHATGYVETLWGRRLYLPDINSSQMMRQKYAERAAINAPLQGSAADIIKLAMIQVAAWLQHTTMDAKMIMQVHDELVFEVAEKDVATAIEKIRELMMNAVTIKVPLLVSIGSGNNWDEASGD